MNLRRRSEATQATVSLFPFLAVLLCTMGALLVLLVVMARQARFNAAREMTEAVETEKAEERREEKGDSQAVDLSNDLADREAELAKLRERAVKMAKMQRDGKTRLDETQLRLGHAEMHLRELADQLASIYATAKQLAALDDSRLADRQNAEEELAQLAQLIRETEAEIAAAREEAVGRPKSYAIVPYQGPHGTHRRPIYIECREEAVILQPEGIELPADDFRDPIGPGNPLASALRAARDYHTAQLADPKEPRAQPYPLLLVRPGGILAYYHAREAIASWGPDFGYELINGDWELHLPSADPQLAHLLYRTVESARARQRALALAAPRRFQEMGSGGTSTGDVAVGGGNRFAVDVEQLPGEADGLWADRQGQGQEDGRPGQWSEDPGDAAATGDSHGPRSGTVVSRASSAGGPEQLTGEPGRSSGGSGEEAGDWGPETEDVNREPTGRGVADGGYPTPGSGPASEDGQQGAPDDPNQNGGLVAGGSTAAEEASDDRASNRYSSSADAHRPPSTRQPSSGAPSGTELAGNSGGAGFSSRGTPGGSASIGSATSSSAASMSGDTTPHWPETKRTPGAVPIRRAIHVVVRGDRLAILPEQGVGGGRVVSVRGDVDASLAELAVAMREHMRGWGIAGRGLYWKPILVLKTAPDGTANAARMVRRLRGSGIEIQSPGGTQR